MSRRLLPPDPKRMNGRRSFWAALAVRCFQRATGTDDGDAVADLLCDLMHFCDRRKFVFNDELERARRHYLAETEP
jgi:hypothetical protein